MEHHPKSFPKKNRFSYVMETAWYDLKKNKTSDEKLLQQKKSILERMQADGFSSLDVYSFLKFIVHYTRFEKYEYLSKFEEHVNFIFKNNRDMSIIELEKFKIKELAKAEGKFEGIDLTFQVIKLLKDDLSIKVIAQKLNISETKVGDIKKQFEEHINFVFKNNRDTSIIELEVLKREQLAKAKGKFEGIGLTLQVIKLLKDDLSIKVIAQKLNISEKEVEDIKKQFEGS
ncbi:MAG: helix-turn-helix domain-containing protein [Bacteroidota bacterium]